MKAKPLLSEFDRKKVLITGNTGFKGSWLSIFLDELGAEVYGFADSLDAGREGNVKITEHNMSKQFMGDIRNYNEIYNAVAQIQPDYIFHLAAHSTTLSSTNQPLNAFTTNAIGTVNLLEAVRNCGINCNLIIITSDKCYKNNEWVWGYRESDILAGEDPYSASKSMAELAVNSYYHTYFKTDIIVSIASCRAGNVIGGGDWNKDRIIPDCIKSWQANRPMEIRNPNAIRPWNYILDVLWGYLLVAAQLQKKCFSGEAFNFGPTDENNLTVEKIVSKLSYYLNVKEPPIFRTQNHCEIKKENNILKLNSEKARSLIKWQPLYNIDSALKNTADWHIKVSEKPEIAMDLSREFVKKYIKRRAE